MKHLSLFDTKAYLESRSISYGTSGKNISSSGWIGVDCPFCADGDNSKHLGINIKSNTISCWKCGTTGTIVKLIMWVERCKFKETIPLLKQFLKDSTLAQSEEWSQGTDEGRHSPYEFYHQLLSEKAMLPHHREYLISRDFYPEEIQFKYKIECIGPAGYWKLRIFIPIFMNKRMVSFTTRDITGLAGDRYRNCPNEFSTVPIRSCLYNVDRIIGDRCIVVEGPFDVWRIGDGCVATLGTRYTVSQMNSLAKMDSIYILFDTTKEAQSRAEALGHDLSALVNHVEVLEFGDTDPAELSTQDVLHLRNEVFRKIY